MGRKDRLFLEGEGDDCKLSFVFLAERDKDKETRPEKSRKKTKEEREARGDKGSCE